EAPAREAKVGGEAEKGREEGAALVRHRREGAAAPGRERVARIVGIGAGALEVERGKDQVSVEEEARAALLRQSRDVVLDGGRVAAPVRGRGPRGGSVRRPWG